MKYSTTKYPCENSLKYINLIFRLSFWMRRLYTQVFSARKNHMLSLFSGLEHENHQSIYRFMYMYMKEQAC